MSKKGKQRIAVIMHNYYPFAVRERREVEALIENGYKVDVYCLQQTGQAKRENSENLNIYRYPIRRKRAGKIRYFMEYMSFFFIIHFVLFFKQFQKRYRLFQVHNIPDFLVFALIFQKIFFRSKVVLDIRDPMPETFRFRFNLSEDHRWIRLARWLEKISMRFSSHVLTVHEELKKVHIERGCKPDRITAIMNLPDEKLFYTSGGTIAKNEDQFLVTYIGTLGERHGVQTAIKSIPQVVKDVPNVKLKVIGEGEYTDELKKLAQDTDVTQYVSFHDYIPVDEVAKELQKADVGICLQQGLFGDIAFPTKVGEYLKMGLPSIVARTKITEAYFNDNIVAFINQGDSKEFAERLVELFKNPDYRERLIKGGQEFSEQRNWNTEKVKYVELIDKILS